MRAVGRYSPKLGRGFETVEVYDGYGRFFDFPQTVFPPLCPVGSPCVEKPLWLGRFPGKGNVLCKPSWGVFGGDVLINTLYLCPPADNPSSARRFSIPTPAGNMPPRCETRESTPAPTRRRACQGEISSFVLYIEVETKGLQKDCMYAWNTPLCRLPFLFEMPTGQIVF